MIDKIRCMSEFLAFRFIKDTDLNFYEGLTHTVFRPGSETCPIETIDDMEDVIRRKIDDFYVPGETAVLLSGGMDSAILASYLPRGTKAYTFRCAAEGAVNECPRAKQYCDIFGLEHEIITMKWSDFEELTPEILRADGVPFHSIEVQLLKAARHAKSQGIGRLIIGESADLIFGGMDQLLAKDWDFDEFMRRYTFVSPESALVHPLNVDYVYQPYRLEGDKIDFLSFMNDIFSVESSSSYMHALNMAGVQYLDPYSSMKTVRPPDLKRIRNGEPKYMVRELFARRYPALPIPEKIPMPRATTQWLKDYAPSRPEFVPHCADTMTGDQKWLCRCLEQFLNMHEPLTS